MGLEYGLLSCRQVLYCLSHQGSPNTFTDRCSVKSCLTATHEWQHGRFPCPSLSPRVCSNSSTESVMPSNYLILCHPPLLLPSIFPSFRVFSSELALHIGWPKYWRFSTSPSNKESGLISFRIDWFDLLAARLTWFDQTGLLSST